MAQRFNLTAQLQLQAPSNTRQIVGQIRKQLKDIGVDVKVKSNTREVAKLNKELQGVSRAGTASAKSMQNLNATLAQSARRFSVITVATGSFLALARAIRSGVSDAVAFERELLKISQVTGKSVKQLKGLTSEVTRLSTSLGTNSSELFVYFSRHIFLELIFPLSIFAAVMATFLVDWSWIPISANDKVRGISLEELKKNLFQ